MVFATSCNQINYRVTDMVPAGADFAAVFSPKQAAEDAGITVTVDNTLQFPESFTSSAGEAAITSIETVNNMLARSGIDLDSMAVYVHAYDERPVYVLKLRDNERFLRKLTSLGFEFIRGQQGIEVYCNESKPGTAVAVRNNIALIVDIEDIDVDAVWRCFYRPDENPMAQIPGPGTFVKGDTANAINIPASVKQALTKDRPGCIDILNFANAVTDMM